jgi:hypothetical protein
MTVSRWRAIDKLAAGVTLLLETPKELKFGS